MKKELAVCLVSGGMDSCVSAAMAGQKYRLALLHVNYGQLTEKRELQAFHDIADHFRVPENLRLAVDVGHFKKIGGSSLTDRSLEIPRAELGRKSIPSTYVPFRNANILALAVSWAEVIGGRHIYIGAMEEDSSGYPDCREEFYQAFNRVIRAGTKPETRIAVETPLMHLTKAEVVRWGMKNGAPFHLTWSCYKSDGPKACGVCDSCALRMRGFQQAGYQDPIEYKKRGTTAHSVR
ncbi:MAG: 7-cyano-7-deazaguanine synthase QueC [Candidatus Aureabacteria bacterium]|nr:7-cyano-7-deazaguanine synthase QueC [Candidatus Auribacterota bacterium]